MTADTNTNPELPAGGRWYVATLTAMLLAWISLVSVLAYLLYARSNRLVESDEANLREWIDEARIYRKSLPELVAEYLDLREKWGLDDADGIVVKKRQEIAQQLQCLADPTRVYQGQIPLFPDIYSFDISFPNSESKPIRWESPLPRPRAQFKAINVLDYPLLGENDDRTRMRCEFRLHAYNARQREAEQAQRRLLFAIGLAAIAGVPALGWAYFALQRERNREVARLRAVQQAEHAANQALEEKVARQDAERATEDLNRQLLERSLEAARQEGRAAVAERQALELKSQLFAGIGIMAGSYAHNIKNLLVRPNDLLARCLSADGLSPQQHVMLGEVRETLGTVTERLQQILKTVRRDPSRAEPVKLDLNAVVGELAATWRELAREKWKVNLHTELCDGPLPVEGDPSHLVQAFENLLFNARDATFEMRNYLREQARSNPSLDADGRRKALLEAAAWKGDISLRTSPGGGTPVLEVSDNGIGMTEEVRLRCTETHFSTKRDNAVFEGMTAGMGLGLSFVTIVLEHHGAHLQIRSTPHQGATFHIRFRADPAPTGQPA